MLPSDPEPVPLNNLPHWITVGGNNAFHNYFNDYSHIADTNLRRRIALTEIDKARFGANHIRAVLVAGVGFFIDAYTTSSVNLSILLLGVVFWSGSDANNGVLPDLVGQALKISTLIGMIVGQLGFGHLADTYGRRKMYGIELGVVIVATLCFSLSASTVAISSTGVLVLWRFIGGIGTGGEFPMSAVISAEFAPTRWRGAMLASVFGMRALGQITASAVALFTAIANRSAFDVANTSACGLACRIAADRNWRTLFGVSAILAVFALYYRLTIPETPRYRFDVCHDLEKADADIRAYVDGSHQSIRIDPVRRALTKEIATREFTLPSASWSDARSYFRKVHHLRTFLGTSLSWLLLDIVAFGLSLNSAAIVEAVGFGSGDTLYQRLVRQALGGLIIAAAGSLPGFLTAIGLIDTVGRKPLQVIGFLILSSVCCIPGFALARLSAVSAMAILCVIQYVLDVGPSTTTFIFPAESFPTRYRATAHGFSAASGSLGGIIAQAASVSLLKPSDPSCFSGSCGRRVDLFFRFFALSALLGAVATFLIPETKGVTLEVLTGEAPTSYNAGRNGSLAVVGRKRWRIFSRGEPAGFRYPRNNHSSSHFRPRAIPPAAEQVSGSGPVPEQLTTISPPKSDPPTTTSAIDDSCFSSPPLVQKPVWGAGWGRLDRGGPQTAVQDVCLHDVSNLLSDQAVVSERPLPQAEPSQRSL